MSIGLTHALDHLRVYTLLALIRKLHEKLAEAMLDMATWLVEGDPLGDGVVLEVVQDKGRVLGNGFVPCLK